MAAAALTMTAAFASPAAAAQHHAARHHSAQGDAGIASTVVARQLNGPDGLAMTYPLAVNGHGQVVGTGKDADNHFQNVLWDHGQLMTLPPVTAGEPTSFTTLNDKGQVAGTETSGSTVHVVVWDHHVPQELDIENPDSVKSINDRGALLVDITKGPDVLYTRGHARKVKLPAPLVTGGFSAYEAPLNNRGQVLVASDDEIDPMQNFVWDKGAATPVSPPGDLVDVSLTAINDQGQVIGAGWSPSTLQSQAFAWQDGTATILPGLSPSSAGVSASAQNESGDVVGSSTVDGGYVTHGVLWVGGQPVDLGSLGGRSTAVAVDEHEEVAGSSNTADGISHATFWRNGHLYDLGVPPGFVSSVATGITGSGKVVGYAVRADRSTAAFVWTVR